MIAELHHAATLPPAFMSRHSSVDEGEMRAPRPIVLGRLLAVAGLCAAFAVMASIFTPTSSEAGDAGKEGEATVSADPHDGLKLIGMLEHRNHLIRIYGSDYGPRYSVYERRGDRWQTLGVLLSEDQMERHHPDLPLRAVEFSGQQLMLAPTDREY